MIRRMTPSRTLRAPLAALLLTIVAMSGCAGEDPTAAGAPNPGPSTDEEAAEGLTAGSEVAVPTWQVGQWFGHHVFFGAGDSEGTHLTTVVVDDAGSYLLASDEADVAMEHALIDYPILGPVSKTDLSTTGLGMDWKLYDFPLRDGKTWDRKVVISDFVAQGGLVAGDELDVTFTATFAEAIPTPDGDRPGYEIEGALANGTLVYRYDYVPDIEWYAHFWMYDYATPTDDDFIFHVMSMGNGLNWTGTYFIDTAEVAVEAFTHVIPPAGPGGVAPAPHATFTVPEGTTYVAGFMFGFALTGVQTVELIDPDGERHGLEPVTDTGNPTSSGGTMRDAFFAVPGKAGDWQVVLVGAGVATVAGVFAWNVVETTGTF